MIHLGWRNTVSTVRGYALGAVWPSQTRVVRTSLFHGVVFQPESHLHSDLEVADLTVANVPTDVGHFKPVQVSNCLSRPCNSVANCLIEALVGSADDFRQAVCAIRHKNSRSWWFWVVDSRCHPYGSGMPARTQVFTITDAQQGLTPEQAGRARRYMVSMILRTVCFIGAVATTGWLRWVLVAGAVLLPYFAVVVANAGRERTKDYVAASLWVNIPQQPALPSRSVERPTE